MGGKEVHAPTIFGKHNSKKKTVAVYMPVVVEEIQGLYCYVEVDNSILKVCGNILEVGENTLEFGCIWL